MMQTLLAQFDSGVLITAGGLIGSACTGLGYAIRWWFTRKDGNEKTLIAGLWDVIRAKDEQIKAQDDNCREMKTTFNALVDELTRTRNKHARCEAKILELRQFAVTQHGTLKRLVAISADPNMFVSDLPDFCEDDWRTDEESKAVDKQIKEVMQNGQFLEANKKLTESSLQLLPKTGGKT